MKVKYSVSVLFLLLVIIIACKKNNPPTVQTNQCTGPEMLAESTLPGYINNYNIIINDAITSDIAGNIYVQNLTAPVSSFANASIAGIGAGYLIKFDVNGKQVYSKPATGSYSVSIGADSLGEVYVGYSTYLEPDHGCANLYKYDSSGDTVWSKHIYYDSDGGLNNIGVKSDGTSYIGAEVPSTPLNTIYLDPTAPGDAGSGAMIYTFDTNGNLTHVKQVDDFYVDTYQFFPSGDFYVLGLSEKEYDQNLNLISTNNIAVPKNGFLFYDATSNAYVCDSTSITKLNAGLTQQWAIKTQPYNLVKTDATGNVYIAGTFNGTMNFNLDGTAKKLTAHGNNDSFMEKFDVNGKMAWVTQSLGTDGKTYTSASQVNNFIVTSKNEVFVTGTALNAKTNTNIHFAALYTQCN